MKKILCNTLIIIFMLGVFFNGYFSFSGLSFSDRVSYAEADNWSNCDTSDLVTAFRYYCKSRNLAIEGSVADALTSFTTTTFNNICSTIGIDPTTLSAELKKTTEGNLGLRFLFSNNGITAYNRIFAEFLQNNDLSVGDSADNEVIFSGDVFTDDNGNSCYIYELASGIDTGSSKAYSKDKILKYGTALVYTSESLFNSMSVGEIFNASFTYKGVEYKGNKSTVSGSSNGLGFGKFQATLHYVSNTFVSIHDTYYFMCSDNADYSSVYGHCCVFKSGSKYYIGSNRFNNGYGTIDDTKCNFKGVVLQNVETEPSDITVNTPNNTVINNNTYNNNYVIIYNDGDTYISDDDDEPLPTTPPSGGGDDPVNPDPLDPYDPTKPFPDTPDNTTPDPGVHGSPGSDGTITLPDFNFDIPDINWSLDGLQHKFPFSLPFDLYNSCKLLNAEPQTPELDYTVDLVVYQWPIQMDLHWLDPAARVIRIFELLAFVVGLILITRHLIGG